MNNKFFTEKSGRIINECNVEEIFVSIIMPAYNVEEYLKESINSLIDQSFKNFELIVIDDASTDTTYDILSEYQDPRIRIYQNTTNQGVARSLNIGLNIAKGKYIARMDADDYCDKDRLLYQVIYLENNPSIGICGTWMRAFNDRNTRIIRYPIDPTSVKTDLFIYCPIGHPTIMGRKEIFHEFVYDEKFDKAEDYDLWERISEKYQITNIGIPLYNYRIHDDSVTWKFRTIQTEKSDEIRIRQLIKIGINPTDYEKFLHNSILCNLKTEIWKDSLNLLKWIMKILRANKMCNKYPTNKLRNLLFYYYWSAIRDSIKLLIKFRFRF